MNQLMNQGCHRCPEVSGTINRYGVHPTRLSGWHFIHACSAWLQGFVQKGLPQNFMVSWGKHIFLGTLVSFEKVHPCVDNPLFLLLFLSLLVLINLPNIRGWSPFVKYPSRWLNVPTIRYCCWYAHFQRCSTAQPMPTDVVCIGAIDLLDSIPYIQCCVATISLLLLVIILEIYWSYII